MSRYYSATATILVAFTALNQPASAQSLLKLDFGRQTAAILAETQSGFMSMEGTTTDPTPASVMFGAYTVNVAAVGVATSAGFFNSAETAAAKIDASVRPLYRDYFYNNNTVNGNGVTLQVMGLTPDVPYNLTLWSYDPAAPNGAVGTVQTCGAIWRNRRGPRVASPTNSSPPRLRSTTLTTRSRSR